MAISRGGFRLLLEEHKRCPFGGNLLQLGRNTIYLVKDEIYGWANQHGVVLKNVPIAFSNLEECREWGCVDDTTLFSAFGFDSIHSCDISGSEGPTFTLDLNQPIPRELCGMYDTVIDSGTIEHIFDLKTVLYNIHALLKPGGRAIFMTVPVSNYVDHGYHMFSPQLLYDYYTINRYRIASSYVIFFKRDFLRDPWMIYNYLPGMLDKYSYGNMPTDLMVSQWLCVEKTEHSVCDIIPQQGCSRSGNPPPEFVPYLQL